MNLLRTDLAAVYDANQDRRARGFKMVLKGGTGVNSDTIAPRTHVCVFLRSPAVVTCPAAAAPAGPGGAFCTRLWRSHQ